MKTHPAPSAPGAWRVRLVTLALWMLAGASGVFWALRLAQPAGHLLPPALPAESASADAQAIARLLGAHAGAQASAAPAPEAPGSAARLVLLGVLASVETGSGVALIAVDGKPPKPYRVGAAVQPGLVLQSVGRRQARLGAEPAGETALVLEIALRNPSRIPASIPVSIPARTPPHR